MNKAGKLGQGFGITNISDQGHIGGPADGALQHYQDVSAGTLSTDAQALAASTIDIGFGVNRATGVRTSLQAAALFKAGTIKPAAASGAGYKEAHISLTGNGDIVDGQIITIDDDGRVTLAQIGMNMEFSVPSDHTLSEADVGKRIIGAAHGLVVPVAHIPDTATLATLKEFALGRGRITRVDNANKRVKVTFWAT